MKILHLGHVVLVIGLVLSPSTSAPRAEIALGDGTVVRATVEQEHLEMQTSYGKLTIPFRDIRKIEFGQHLPPGKAEEIAGVVEQLGDADWRTRQRAEKALFSLGPLAYPAVKDACTHKDAEIARRAASLAKRLEDHFPGRLKTKLDDTIHGTGNLRITGRILSPEIHVYTEHLGALKLKLHALDTMCLRLNDHADFTLDAAQFGSEAGKWFDTGVFVAPTATLRIAAKGEVDLWPQGAGQYTAGPTGHSSVGKGTSFKAGALIGRIGAKGKVFLVGAELVTTATEEGALYLQIVPSSWNNASYGAYKVKIDVE